MIEFRKLLVANRSEIAIRVFRTAHELGIRTVAIYSHEDRFALHRFKADEAYQVGKPGEPIRAYLDIDGIVALAKEYEVDAIHPGYGFLSENAEFARACATAGIIFVGPRPEILEQLGDKVAARGIAAEGRRAGPLRQRRPVEPTPRRAGRWPRRSAIPSSSRRRWAAAAAACASSHEPDELDDALDQARREAQTAFGMPDVFLEKFVRRARHIEVQLLGDQHGNLVHLFERDCSVQRRHQKVVEIAPAPNLDPALREAICDAALAVGRHVRLRQRRHRRVPGRRRHGRVLLHRGQPAHPGRAHRHRGGHRRRHRQVPDPDRRRARRWPTRRSASATRQRSRRTASPSSAGSRPRTRRTTSLPDYGRITHYRSAGGLGIRLDARHGLRRRGHHAVLRLAAGEGHGLRPAVRRRGAADGARPAGVPRPRREDEHPVPAEPGHAPDVPGRRLHHPVHRRDARAVPASRRGRTGPRKLLDLHRRGDRQRPSRT